MAANVSTEDNTRKKIQIALWITIIGLLLNGLSAFPLQAELRLLLQFRQLWPNFLETWWDKVYNAISETSQKYPLVLYGFDWLGVAHFMIAIAFIGPLRNPVKNQWVVQWGMIVSGLSIVMALVGERFRDIPFFWSLIDTAIGLVAFAILWLCNHWIEQLKEEK